jgi:Glu-tRNA(Gln) amidotransferase subunit E-like FAD-binding protein
MRKLRAVAGEMGQIDIAAIYEYLRDRTFYYQVFNDSTCLVELDEEPPHEINKEAFEIALQIARLLKCEIPNEIHVMRKTVIDGSNTAGFQRTAIVGINGVIETSKGNVRITNVSLEEESAGIVDQSGNDITYRLDRLGIPLIEIGTETDIKDSEHAQEVAKKLGMFVRSTGKSQRGIGVTRQDVNVSIRGGARVEVKGVQELDSIPKIVENEVNRQREMILKKEIPKKETRVVKDETTEFLRPLPGGERMYPETDVPPIIITEQFLKQIKLPETLEEKYKKYLKLLPKEMAEQIIWNEYSDYFEKFYKKYEPVIVANTFISTIKDLRRQGFDTYILTEDYFEELFANVKNKKIAKEAIPNILEVVLKENIPINEAIVKYGFKALSEEELRKIIREIFRKYPHLVKEKRISALMGEVMKSARGKIDGKTISKVLNEELKKE